MSAGAEYARFVIEGQEFSVHVGLVLVSLETDRAVVRMPYAEHLGTERVNGGAIATLVDTTATCAFWSHPDLGAGARGATVGFTIHYLRLVVRSDLTATATVRRRGGSLCVGEVSVENARGEEVALATVTYKLDP